MRSVGKKHVFCWQGLISSTIPGDFFWMVGLDLRDEECFLNLHIQVAYFLYINVRRIFHTLHSGKSNISWLENVPLFPGKYHQRWVDVPAHVILL